ERFCHIAFGGRAPLAQGIGGIANHRQNAVGAELAQSRRVGRWPDRRRRIDLPVTGVQHGAEPRANGHGVGLRNRVRHRDKLHVERPDAEAGIEGHLRDRQLQLAAEVGKFGLEHRRRERRCIDRHAEPRPQLDHGTHVVLVRMREHEACQIGPLLLDEAQIGQDDIDVGVVLTLGEGDAEIDHQPLARGGGAEAVEIAVHADLADAAERHEDKLVSNGRVARALHQPRSWGAARANVTSPNVSLRRCPPTSRMRRAPPSSRPRKVPAMRSRPVSTLRLSPTAPAYPSQAARTRAKPAPLSHASTQRSTAPARKPSIASGSSSTPCAPRWVAARPTPFGWVARLMPMPITTTASELSAAIWLSGNMPAHLAAPIKTSLGHFGRSPASGAPAAATSASTVATPATRDSWCTTLWRQTTLCSRLA